MGRNRKYKRRSPWVAAVLCAVMLFGNTALVYAASDRFVHAYASWYDDTAACEEEAPQVMEELTEYTDSGPADDITVLEDNPRLMWRVRHRDTTCALCLENFREEAFLGREFRLA